MATATITSPVDVTVETPGRRYARLVTGNHDFNDITRIVSDIPLARKTPIGWWIAFIPSLSLALLFFGAISYMIATASA